MTTARKRAAGVRAALTTWVDAFTLAGANTSVPVLSGSVTSTGTSNSVLIGSGTATVWTCDLTKEYVAINGDYRS